MPVRSGYLYCQHQQAKGLLEASDCMDIAQRYLTISAMAKHFPRTFARMVNSTLTVQDEHEPAFDDDEGELFWPGQCITGEGLGWVALMGESMIREYGKEFGYKGMECIITKPPDAVSSSGGVPTPVIIPKMELEVLKR
ncbi:hypothetical protein A0H81_11803 [Grifola frondosa]|uniref:Uncharacterized protein n=1 Tax=Grifola frondosa TaxID=5627 RepID=A0A1C7LU53_GRIFR|nr:hypothetical protein A0H81_11803 [Grifola frondosa]